MLDEKILQERLANFVPEPLIDYEHNDDEVIEIPMVQESDDVVDLAKANYLNVLKNEEIKKTSEDIIRKYGVGTCGPRAFYGTTDVHLEVEEYIAKFLGLELSIVYSYGFVAISSSIAAYCRRNDVVFIDEEANFAIHQGLTAAKSKTIKFAHNDPKDFYKKVKEYCAGEKKKRAKYLVIEGINWKTGKLCPLPDFLAVAEEFRIRVFLEESYSFGVLGEKGQGLTGHFNIDVSRIDMIFGTLEGAVGSIGGFCAGISSTIEHQSLSGSGYIFSASLPTYLAKIVVKSLESIGDKPMKLRLLTGEFHDFLEEACNFEVTSDRLSPFQAFTAKDRENREEKVKRVHEYCREHGVHFICKGGILYVNLNVELYDNKDRLQKVYDVLKEASKLA